MEKTLWGYTKEQEEINVYTLHNAAVSARFMNYGANLLSLNVPDKNGCSADVVLGYEKLSDYFVNDPCFGCTVAPVANRIQKASFTLNGKTYQLDKNDGNNNLHSGLHPLHHRIWNVTELTDSSITFAISCKDMDMGFPGNRRIQVSYTLTSSNALVINYSGTSDKDTLFNPTNHSYFNLAGQGHGDILQEMVTLDATTFTYADSESIPDGTIRNVKDTPMDFTTAKALGQDIESDYDQIVFGNGYDHNFILDQKQPSSEFSDDRLFVFHAGSCADIPSGRKMDIYTSLPGLQLYTGNFLNSSDIGKGHVTYHKHAGVAFETQYFPNAIHVPSFAQPVLAAGETAVSRTVYQFSAS